MKNDKSKNIIISLLLVIIVVLVALVVLFATDTLSFNFNNDDLNNPVENIVDNCKKIYEEEISSIGSYQAVLQMDPYLHRYIEFKLESDNTVNYVIGHSISTDIKESNIEMNYSGTYIEKDDKIILSIISTDSNCEDGKYACIDIITLSKKSDGTLVNSDSLTEIYNKVENLLFIK